MESKHGDGGPASQHPIRDADLHVFAGIGAAEGRYIARFHPYDTYPIFFSGRSAEGAEGCAEAFRAETIAKHEGAFVSRQVARAKARAAREAKKSSAAREGGASIHVREVIDGEDAT